jgi:phage protein U
MNDREYLNFRASDRAHAIEQLQRHSAWRFDDNPRLAKRATR